jgi:ribosomal protein S18
MSEKEVKAMLSEARQLVSNHCGQIVRSVGEMGYIGDQQQAFCKFVSGQLLGASLDLWLEIHGDDPEPLKRFVTMRLQAKAARDTGVNQQKSH